MQSRNADRNVLTNPFLDILLLSEFHVQNDFRRTGLKVIILHTPRNIYMCSNIVFEYTVNFFHRVPLVHFTANAI